MRQTLEMLQERFRDLNNDLARVSKILADRPEAFNDLRPTLLALGEAIKDVHAKISAIDLH